ncbi:hypothetical protein DFH08DRAFT_907104 [Mycena albidolilacea]|uniref:Uncharacterized protein n=1 Tax=Mycena albidolilacea TaxID=1033008 RepID=A0AAD6YXP4_9AGAR|nr:hypothetical protein DFH08DRAFT_907104 [Mycena albidolilacea]
MSSYGFDGAKIQMPLVSSSASLSLTAPSAIKSGIESLSLASFKIHFLVLDYSGPDDAQMSSPFQVNLAETTVLGIR